jgi:DNA-binding NarL/FixJ family response regulator
MVTVRRSVALLRLATTPDESGQEAMAALDAAADAYAELGLEFDAARTRLALGAALRRRRRWGAAREALDTAAEAFDAMASPGWAERARLELDRVGARRPAPRGELTATERRVAELAASGRANKEIARALAVSVHTVEVHLSRAYAKLGVRSRGQLAGRLGDTG